MLSDLAALIDQEDFERCVELGEALLVGGGLSAAGTAEVYYALCCARTGLQDYLGAVRDGEKAAELARQAGEDTLLGLVLVDLGVACLRLRRYEQADTSLRTFLDELPHRGEIAHKEGAVRQNLGLALMYKGQYHEAEVELVRARNWFERSGRPDAADGCRRSLIQVLLREGALQRIGNLLQEGDDYLTTFPEDQDARIQHLLGRAEYLCASGKPAEAVRWALEALKTCGDRITPMHAAYMLLHRAALALDHHRDALGFALSARMAALDAHRYDLSHQSTVAMIELLRAQGPEPLTELERHYRGYGIDIYQYVPESAARRHTATN